jgi:hypothetical protein
MKDVGKGKHGRFHLRNGAFVQDGEEEFIYLSSEPDIMWPTGENRIKEYAKRYRERRLDGFW